MGGIGVNDEEGLGKISRRWQFHRRHPRRHEATKDKRDADYKVAIEKCDALAGPAKDSCVSGAKAQYGK
jgi:hypothetical protein